MGALEDWFIENQRDFPWRQNRTPYRVWISEVMLQQTRAAAVVPYFLRWMDQFPDVKALYNAPLDAVIKAWEGLGYYSRARNIHLAAKQIVEQFDGKIPDTLEKLLSLKGFGPYTVGAVLNFAFQKRARAVDGNVIRVISRYFSIEENISKSATRKKIEERTELLLDPAIPWVSSEALIELGATLCSPIPRCDACPLKGGCLGFKEGKAQNLPIKKEDRKIIELFRGVLVVECDGHVLVRKGERGKVMADLYEFPYYEDANRKIATTEAIRLCGNEIYLVKKLSSHAHTFTHYKANLFPYLFRARKRCFISDFQWVEIARLSQFPFSSGHRRIASEIEIIYTQGYSRKIQRSREREKEIVPDS